MGGGLRSKNTQKKSVLIPRDMRAGGGSVLSVNSLCENFTDGHIAPTVVQRWMVMGMGKHDYITKDFALYVVHYFNSMLTWSKKDILGEIDIAIKEAKPEDVVKVVRCKDCKFGEMCSIREAMALTDPNGYCCRGERRADGGRTAV
jgi:hypothetical protein